MMNPRLFNLLSATAPSENRYLMWAKLKPGFMPLAGGIILPGETITWPWSPSEPALLTGMFARAPEGTIVREMSLNGESLLKGEPPPVELFDPLLATYPVWALPFGPADRLTVRLERPK